VRSLADSVAAAVRKWIPCDEHVLVACSGGADSTALAAAVSKGFRASIGHIDHGLRAASAHDAAAVRALAQALGLPFFMERLQGLEVSGSGLEAAAREARYPALARLAAQAGASLVATAHTRRDQAETLLMRLIRGAGPGALAGVRRRRPLAPGIELLRPLLDVERAATEELCRSRQLPFIDDPHNSDPARARAKLRALWPTLLALNPRLEEALAGAAETFASEDELLLGLASGSLAEMHPALQRRALLARATAEGLRPERQHLEALLRLLERGAGTVDLPGGHAILSPGGLRFAAGKRVAPVQPLAVAIAGPGSYAFDSREVVVRSKGEGIPVDLSRAPFPWSLRARRPGDRYRPVAGRTRKVSDWLIDARIPKDDRAGLVLLEDARGKVFFVEGLRASDALRESSESARFLLVRK
jgi:tRNA(Ile)-lysidine synthase